MGIKSKDNKDGQNNGQMTQPEEFAPMGQDGGAGEGAGEPFAPAAAPAATQAKAAEPAIPPEPSHPGRPKKPRGRLWPARVLCAFTVLVITLVFCSLMQDLFRQSQENKTNYFDQESFAIDMVQAAYTLNWRLEKTLQNNPDLTPAELYFPTVARLADRARAAEEAGNYESYGNEPATTPAATAPGAMPEEPEETTAAALGGEEQIPPAAEEMDQIMLDTLRRDGVESIEIITAADGITSVVENWQYEYNTLMEDDEYYALDKATNAYTGSGDSPLAQLAQLARQPYTGAVSRDWLDTLDYAVVLRFDETGNVSALWVHGGTTAPYGLVSKGDIKSSLTGWAGTLAGNDTALGQVKPPTNRTFAFAVPKDSPGAYWTQRDRMLSDIHGISYVWFAVISLVALAAALLIGMLYTAIPKLNARSLRFARLPLELVAACAVGIVVLAEVYPMAQTLVFGEWYSMIPFIEYLPLEIARPLALGLYGAGTALVFTAVLCSGMSLCQVFVRGPKEFLTKQLWTVRFILWLWGLARRFGAWAASFDLTQPGAKRLLIVLAANFVICTAFCCVWVIGIPFLLAYSIALFVLAYHQINKIKHDHDVLLGAARQMAEGRLDVDIPENLGLFESLKQELLTVRGGFSRAVVAEMKSQSMKTELITNVSHDLKTPLTAIITYVDLLKKEDITEEERRSYVQTLDQKSQRLKHLIEDLFEVSRANSQDVSLQLATVDLPALIKQVVAETQDELGRAGIEVRYRLPEEKVQLTLDGGKTSRIFQNLLGNITKYGLACTRAYITVAREGENVRAEVQNISREELDFDSAAITERFVRGDASRSTDGFGLGLAIVKSFTEVQGGSFAVQTDGDVFKAVLHFPLYARLPMGGEGEGSGQAVEAIEQ